MNTTFFDLVSQSYTFPQRYFSLNKDSLSFRNYDLQLLINKYGTPLKVSFLPSISDNINRAKKLFGKAIIKHNYNASYIYSYCTKSSHFKFVLEEVLKNDVHLELSSAFDVDLCLKLEQAGVFQQNGKTEKNKIFLICNGFKTKSYVNKIKQILNLKTFKPLLVLDSLEEIEGLLGLGADVNLGIRIASEEDPQFEFYTSRLGIRFNEIVEHYKSKIQSNKRFELKMLHFFINTGIHDTAYYWNELSKVLNVYIELKRICPELDMLNIGGGLPIQSSLGFEYDYQYMIDSIVGFIKTTCDNANVVVPNIVTEFGNFTVGESGVNIFKIIEEKQQNDRETWYLIDGSLMNTIPDIYGINQRFVLLPINKWNESYKRVNIGGLSCDGMDYYNSEVNVNDINLPIHSKKEPLYVGFFHTGAYQESLSGFGGIKHCLIPSPKHILVKKDEDGNFVDELFAEEQTAEQMLKILGY